MAVLAPGRNRWRYEEHVKLTVRTPEVEPFVALMRRYCIDYTTVHDVSVIDDIMRTD